MTLQEAVGKTISDFCGCEFTDAATNHCAHFVSHYHDYQFGMTCRKLTGKGTKGANVRVQELFPQCPEVGWLKDWKGQGQVLVFVTAKSNVDLAKKSMANVPKKHIGIYDGSHVYHYSNAKDKVVKQTVAEFQAYFGGVYSGDLGYYYGTLPGSDLIPMTADTAPGVTHELRAGEVYARIDGGAEFFVARRVTYGKRVGLAQTSKLTGPIYDPAASPGLLGQWAYMVYVIGESESRNRFNRINSYDRAAFTFGFYQLAAHTPNDNLVLLLRAATRIPAFRARFPELQLRDGRLHRVEGSMVTDLEVEVFNSTHKESQLRNLMLYLNPSGEELDDGEIVHAAKLVALCEESREFRDLQVVTAVEITKRKFRERYQRWYGLAGASDTLCTAIADIHHQGRGKKAQVLEALQSSDPLKALTRIGEGDYPERCRSLRDTLQRLVGEGKLGKHRYEPAHGVFVPV